MRDLIRDLLNNARRSGDRIGVDGTLDKPEKLAAETIRLARLAASIHLAESARLTAAGDSACDRMPSTREILR